MITAAGLIRQLTAISGSTSWSQAWAIQRARTRAKASSSCP
jgi:hypothetical protein